MNFVSIIWRPYRSLRGDDRNEQVRSLFGPGLYEPNHGAEYCFVPTENMLQLDLKLQELCSKLKVIDQNTQLCNEVFYTSKMEGALTTLSRTMDICNGAEADEFDKSELMLLGGFNAVKFLNLVNHRELTQDAMLKCWNILIDGCCENESIRGERYRTGNVQVGKHVGLNPVLLDDAMELWVNYFNSETLNEHPFIKASLLHFAFEYIHPFCDGNGRLGRLLLTDFLVRRGYEALHAVSFSKAICSSRPSYDYALEVSDNVYCDCTPLIEYLLMTMLNSIYNALDDGTIKL